MTKSMHTDDRCTLCVSHFFLGQLATVANTKTTLMRHLISLVALFLHVYPDTGHASDDNEPRLINQVNYSVALTTSGQPTKAK